MTTIRVHIDPSSPGFAAIDNLVEGLSNPGGLLKNLGDTILKNTQSRFDDQRGPGGIPWAPLAPLTTAIRGASGPILRQSGRLAGSLNFQVSGNSVRVGPNTVYAAAQQFGAHITPKKGPFLLIPLGRAGKGGVVRSKGVTLPPRPYLGFDAESSRELRETIEDWILANVG